MWKECDIFGTRNSISASRSRGSCLVPSVSMASSLYIGELIHVQR
jgi:hypothetical protein